MKKNKILLVKEPKNYTPLYNTLIKNLGVVIEHNMYDNSGEYIHPSKKISEIFPLGAIIINKQDSSMTKFCTLLHEIGHLNGKHKRRTVKVEIQAEEFCLQALLEIKYKRALRKEMKLIEKGEFRGIFREAMNEVKKRNIYKKCKNFLSKLDEGKQK